MAIFLLLLCLAAGYIAGWRVCRVKLYKNLIEENLFLRNHVEEVKQNSRYWLEQSANNREVHNSTINNHNNNLRNTLENMLFILQRQEKENLKEGEKERVENIIQSIKKGISPF